MKQEDEIILKATKEIVVKFIEIGRLSVGSFDEVFKNIHQTVHDSVRERVMEEK